VDAEISVIVPCFNAERYVEQTIRSALSQDCDLEVVVIDDGSTDRSASIVRAIADEDRRVTLLTGPNQGVANARNTGVRAMSPTSRFVMFLDADDVLAAGALSALRNRLDHDTALAAAFGSRSRIDESGSLIQAAPTTMSAYHAGARRVQKVLLTDAIDYWHVAAVNPISTPGQCLVRVSHLPNGDVFDQRFAPCEDWALWFHLTRHHDIGVEHHEVLSYRDHDSSASRGYTKMYKQRVSVLTAQVPVLPLADHRRLRTAWRFGMFGFDARLSLRWARDRAAARDPLGAARYLLRSLRYQMRQLAAVIRREPDIVALAAAESRDV
jgi:glycosyltransferase involved in cell wall biosynthesis